MNVASGRIGVTGIGICVPDTVLTNQQIEDLGIGAKAQWIADNLGIKQRRIVREGQMTSDLAVMASERALRHARLDARDIDLLIVATFTPDFLVPSMSAVIKKQIGADYALCMDVRAGCAGFASALVLARQQYITEDDLRNILVIGADTYSRVADWTNRSECSGVGDGAGAFVLQELEPEDKTGLQVGLLHHESMRDWSDGCIQLFYGEQPAGTRLTYTSDGKYLYGELVRTIPVLVNKAARKAGWELEEIDWFVLPQINRNLIRELAQSLGIPEQRTIQSMGNYGYTSNPCLPIAVYDAIGSGLIERGHKVMMVGAGAGNYYAAIAMIWGGTRPLENEEETDE